MPWPLPPRLSSADREQEVLPTPLTNHLRSAKIRRRTDESVRFLTSAFLMKPAAVSKPQQTASEARREQRQEEILDAAVELFARHGYSESDIQVLADTLGVGKGTIYRHFPSKQDLFLAAVDRVIRQLHQRLNERTADVADPLERIIQGVRAYLGFFTEHPELAELLIQERAQFKDRKKPTYFAYRERNVERRRAMYRCSWTKAACGTCRPSASPTFSATCSTAACSPTTSTGRGSLLRSRPRTSLTSFFTVS